MPCLFESRLRHCVTGRQGPLTDCRDFLACSLCVDSFCSGEDEGHADG